MLPDRYLKDFLHELEALSGRYPAEATRPAWEILRKSPQDTVAVHHVDAVDVLLVVQTRVNAAGVEIIASGPKRQVVAHGA